MSTPLLRVEDLAVRAAGAPDARPLLSGISFQLTAGSTVGVVGASGAGKSTLALAIMRLLSRSLVLDPTSRILLGDQSLHAIPEAEMRAVRGARVSMVFQEPLLALDPAMTIGAQVAEAALVHGVSPLEARRRTLEMLDRVGLGDPRAAAARFPHELSGGMRQRALIAAAMLLRPALLLADEPTTALDPTIQAQVLDLLDQLRDEAGTTLVLISHDLAVVGERCARVLALAEGRLVADGPATEVLRARRASTAPVQPARTAPPAPARVPPLLEVSGLAVRYRTHDGRSLLARQVTAVHEVDFSIARGEVLGVVGESGCGKSSIAHAVLRLIEPASGAVRFDGENLLALAPEPLRRLRRRMQLVPQDAGASLTPHCRVEDLVAEGFTVHALAEGAEAVRRARQLLDEVGVPERLWGRLPRELSSGERQRVAIARALAPAPDLLVCDEPLASVDGERRERILELLEQLRTSRNLTLLVISHDLEAVRRLATRVIVLYLGRVIEASAGSLALTQPRMPYTQALVAATPTGDPEAVRRRIVLQGELPSPASAPSGCAFHPRCPHPLKDDRCRSDRPPLASVAMDAEDHLAACWKLQLPMSP